MTITQNEWRKHFPFPTPRKEQEIAIDIILNAFKSGKKFVIADMPPGIGKSAIGLCVSNYLTEKGMNTENGTAYILTTQIILQEQYIKDFPHLASISSKSNYTCNKRSLGMTCDIGLSIAKAVSAHGGPDYKEYAKTCCYEIAKNDFLKSNIGISNLPYFMSMAKGEQLKFRELLVIDECHNLESVVTQFATSTFTRYFVEEVLKMDFNVAVRFAKYNISSFINWIFNAYNDRVESIVKDLENKIKMDKGNLESRASTSIMKKIEEMNRILDSIKMLKENYLEDEWVLTVADTDDVINIKPIFANKFTQKFVFNKADKFLMMSGTILNKHTFCEINGIKESEAEFITMPSPFAIENRPIYKVNIGSMSRKNIQNTLPSVVEAIKFLLEEHKKDKGIIHTWSYQTSYYINQNIENDRLLYHSPSDRGDMLSYHYSSSEPTVLVSPSLIEGVDLFDNNSRFQIIAKVMYPYLGDNYVKIKMERVKDWYQWQTIKNMIQASGRSIRNENDHAITYILDSDINFLIDKYNYLFPKWWLESVKVL